jgi:3-isopropylmalate/(R)-2-methylmalate dehydratase large subunit
VNRINQLSIQYITMNLAEKLLAAHAGKKSVSPGEFLSVKVDLVMTTDATGMISVQQLEKMGAEKVFDPQKVVFVMDHFTPCRDIESAETVKRLRAFAMEQGLIWYEAGQAGICHTLLPEQGLVLPGDVLVGGDSHTCTAGALGAFATGMGSTDIAAAMATGEVWMLAPPSIRFRYHGRLPEWVGGKDLILHTIGAIGVDGAAYAAMEFAGDAIDALSMDHRFTMANMAIEAGGKAGLFAVDEKTLEYVRPRAKKPFAPQAADPDAEYLRTHDFEVSGLSPQVALPHSPGNSVPVEAAGDVEIDQAVIGSCTNGRLDDLREAARVLSGRKIDPRVRCIVIPATQEIYLAAVREGLIETFIRAGAVVSPPTCGPCPGGHMGVVAAGEKVISSTNRNFIGRMGSPKAFIYLANPAVAAASAVTGRITHPKEVAIA